jgi:hypothetical protein
LRATEIAPLGGVWKVGMKDDYSFVLKYKNMVFPARKRSKETWDFVTY